MAPHSTTTTIGHHSSNGVLNNRQRQNSTTRILPIPTPDNYFFFRLTRTPDINLKACDIQTLLTSGTQTHQELLIFGLENACKIHGGTYLEPAFFPILQQHGWGEVIQWLSPNNASDNNPHYQHPNISIPIHIHGNHWVAVNRRIIGGKVRFLYADDLNNAATERTIKQLLFENAPSTFCPPGSTWITCTNTTYRPHSNECGPRSVLALTVFMSHPNPHKNVLQPCMHPNLAMTARTWLGVCIITWNSPNPNASTRVTQHAQSSYR